MADKLTDRWLHLGLGATTIPQPPFTGMQWYEDYTSRHEADGREGRLVSMYTFTESWSSWEMHPEGSEMVLCTAGEITVIQEIDGEPVRTTLQPGEYAINQAALRPVRVRGQGAAV